MHTFLMKIGCLFLTAFISMNCLANSEALWLEIKGNLDRMKQNELPEMDFIKWFQRRIFPRSKIFNSDSNVLPIKYFDLTTKQLKRNFVNAEEVLEFSDEDYDLRIHWLRANVQKARKGEFVYLIHVCTLEQTSPPLGDCGGCYRSELKGVLFLFKEEELYYQTDNPEFNALGITGLLYDLE